MQLAGVTKAGTTLHQAMIPKPRESVFITDAILLPPNLVSVEQKLLPDKAAILAAIHAGYKILGAEIQNKPSLRIK
jgi:hypothetical protein